MSDDVPSEDYSIFGFRIHVRDGEWADRTLVQSSISYARRRRRKTDRQTKPREFCSACRCLLLLLHRLGIDVRVRVGRVLALLTDYMVGVSGSTDGSSEGSRFGENLRQRCAGRRSRIVVLVGFGWRVAVGVLKLISAEFSKDEKTYVQRLRPRLSVERLIRLSAEVEERWKSRQTCFSLRKLAAITAKDLSRFSRTTRAAW